MRSAVFLAGIGLAVIAALPLQSAAERNARICIAPPPAAGSKSAAFPDLVRPELDYHVRFNGGEWIAVPAVTGVWHELPIQGTHLVETKEASKRHAAFHFSFDQGEANPDKCLFINGFYNTWQLWPWRRTGKWCNCPQS